MSSCSSVSCTIPWHDHKHSTWRAGSRTDRIKEEIELDRESKCAMLAQELTLNIGVVNGFNSIS